jgi:transcriptional regulator with XRE-family HTH domain
MHYEFNGTIGFKMARHSKLVRCDSLTAKTFRSKLYPSANAGAHDLGLNVKTIRLIESGKPVSLSKVQQYAERLGVSIEELLHDHVDPSENIERLIASPTPSELFSFRIFSGLFTELIQKKAVAHVCNNETVLSLISSGGVRLDNQLIDGNSISCSPVWLLAEGTESTTELAEELKCLLVQINKSLDQETSSLENLIGTIELRCDLAKALLSLQEKCKVHILGANIKTEHENLRDVMTEEFASMPVEITIPVFFVAPLTIREVYFEYEALSSGGMNTSDEDAAIAVF